MSIYWFLDALTTELNYVSMIVANGCNLLSSTRNSPRDALAVTAAVEQERGDDSLGAFAGLVHRSPLQAVALLVFLTSLAGVPPLAGFAGKFMMFGAAMAESTTPPGTPSLTWLVGLAAVMSAISLYYYLMLLKQAFVREDADATPVELSTSHRLALLIPAVLLVALGLFPALLLSPLTRALQLTFL
ncbi:MAG: proton-conducting transporter membrane subunit [Deltaproteobacteria bacterium]